MIGKIKTAIMSIALVVLLASNVFAWTTHPIRAGKDGGGSWRLTTIPEDVYGTMGKLPYITMLRKANGPWKRLSPLGDLSDLLIFEEPLKNTYAITKALDKIISPEEIIVVTYYTIINEAVIYYHRNRWKNKEFHENIAKEFNKLRTAFLFIHNVVYSSKIINSEIINHELKLTKDGGGDYMISSVPQELREELNEVGRIGMMSSIFISRRDGKWDSSPLVGSRYPLHHPSIKDAIERLQLFMDLCDKAVPDEDMSLGYYVDYNEIIIYLDPDLWKNKTRHEEVIKKLNNAVLGEMI